MRTGSFKFLSPTVCGGDKCLASFLGCFRVPVTVIFSPEGLQLLSHLWVSKVAEQFVECASVSMRCGRDAALLLISNTLIV
jgi:hypothetical protein